MKANQQTKAAADFLDVRHGDDGVVYRCLKCGFESHANAYYEADHKTMINHVAGCDGQGLPEEPRAIVKAADFNELNEYVRQLAGHIKKCVPNGDKLKNDEAIALARISMATGLSPFTGELWYIPGSGPHVGIKGLRRKAKKQSLYSGQERLMRPEEITEHGVREEDIGYVYEGFRFDATREAAEINKLAGKPIIPILPITGIGIWRKAWPERKQYKDDPIPHGRSAAWVAKKRAEADFLTQAFDLGIDLPFTDEPEGYVEANGSEDAGWSVLPPEGEIIRREAAMNGERRTQAGARPVETECKVTVSPDDLPPWVLALKDKIRKHPKASDPVDNGSVQQLKISAGYKVKVEQFQAVAEFILGHRLEEATFGEVAVLLNDFVNSKDFEAQIIGLLS